MSAVPNLLAMQIAGLGQTALYAGSWSEWSNTPGLPTDKAHTHDIDEPAASLAHTDRSPRHSFRRPCPDATCARARTDQARRRHRRSHRRDRDGVAARQFRRLRARTPHRRRKQTVDSAIAQLRAADQLFKIDPTANCKLGPVTLRLPRWGWARPRVVTPTAMRISTAPLPSTAPTPRQRSSSTSACSLPSRVRARSRPRSHRRKASSSAR